jgi:hypothetical protein
MLYSEIGFDEKVFRRKSSIDWGVRALQCFRVLNLAGDRRAHTVRTQERIEMRFHWSLLSVAFIVFFLSQSDALPIDPLDPSRLGESMSIPLSQGPVSVNVTGSWSFDLMGKTSEKMKLYLTQNEDSISGRGVIIHGTENKKATASGLLSGDRMSLSVAPDGASDRYSLNLSLSSLAGGTYTVYLADGSSRSGKATFTVFANIFQDAFNDEDDSDQDANPAAAMPSWL